MDKLAAGNIIDIDECLALGSHCTLDVNIIHVILYESRHVYFSTGRKVERHLIITETFTKYCTENAYRNLVI